MANSGYTDVAATSQDTLRFSWSVSSQSIADNTSTVSWEMRLIASSHGYIDSSYNKNWSVTIAGLSYSGTNKINIGNNQEKVLASGTTVISHGADGNKSFTYYFSQQFNIYWSGNLIRNVDGSGSGSLPTIARATTPSLSPSSQVMGNSITINLPRASSSFTHTVQYIFGSASGTIATGVGTSTSWTIPTSLASQIPNATGGYGTIRCITYNGSTQIGSKDVSFYASVPGSSVPTISKITISDTQTHIANTFGALVQGKSTMKVTTSATGVSGSTITSCQVSYQGKSYSGTSVTIPVTGSGNQDVNVTITDSRGRTATSTKSISILPYTSPTISQFTIARCNDSGVLDDDGTNAKVSMNFSISSCNNKNLKSHKVEYVLSTSSTGWKTAFSGSVYSYNSSQIITGNLFNTDYAYSIRLTISDYFTSVTSIIELPTAFTLIDLHQTGKGMAFGKVAAKEGLENALETWHTEPIHFQDQILLSGIFGNETSLIDFLMPIGTIKEFSKNINPNQLYPGTTWTQIKGRVLVGVDESDNDFKTVGATGGEKTHKLTSDEMPSHRHAWRGVNATALPEEQYGHYPFTIYEDYAANWQGGTEFIEPEGNDQPHNNMPPYKVVYIWERTK